MPVEVIGSGRYFRVDPTKDWPISRNSGQAAWPVGSNSWKTTAEIGGHKNTRERRAGDSRFSSAKSLLPRSVMLLVTLLLRLASA